MKSKIQFDLDDQQKPILITTVIHTDDIRDKVAYNCIYKMNCYPEDNGNLIPSSIGVAVIKYKHESQDLTTTYTIEPLCDFGKMSGYNLADLHAHLTQAANKVKALIDAQPKNEGTKIYDPK